MARLFLAVVVAVSCVAAACRAAERRSVISDDGAPIAFECEGAGPEVLIVHGGVGDRTRWTPMFPHLSARFTVCAMDRRGRGESGDGPRYSLAREAEDVAAVVKSRGRPVVVLGHSFGGVTAFEAAFLTAGIRGLILYEPPLRVRDGSAVLARIEALLKSGDRDAAAATFQREIVLASLEELAAVRARPAWKTMVASIDLSIRQHRALMRQRWDPSRAAGLKTPTLILMGGRTTNADLKLSAQSLLEALPNSSLVTLEGHEHNAMDTDREGLAAVIRTFVESLPDSGGAPG